MKHSERYNLGGAPVGERLFSEWLREDPDWGWGYIGRSDKSIVVVIERLITFNTINISLKPLISKSNLTVGSVSLANRQFR